MGFRSLNEGTRKRYLRQANINGPPDGCYSKSIIAIQHSGAGKRCLEVKIWCRLVLLKFAIILEALTQIQDTA